MTPSTATTEELIQQMDNPRFWGMGHLDPAWYNRKRELMNSRLGISIIFFKLTVDGVDYVIDHLGRRHTGARGARRGEAHARARRGDRPRRQHRPRPDPATTGAAGRRILLSRPCAGLP